MPVSERRKSVGQTGDGKEERRDEITEIDYTMMSTYQTCQRRFYFRHVEGWDLKRPQMAPAFGGAIHEGLDVWYRTKDVEEAVRVFKEAFKENPTEDGKRTHKVGEWILKNYADKYRDQPWKLLQSETAFSEELPNGKRLMGRVDKIIEWDGVLWVVDHKTTSQLGAQFFKMASPSLQFPGYVWAARKMGYPVVGVVVDAILVAKGLLESSSRARLTPLARYDEYMSDALMKDWMRTVTEIQESIDLSLDEGRWTPNFDACTYYGECPYRRVCCEDRDLWERILKMDYVVDFWHPNKEGGKDGQDT